MFNNEYKNRDVYLDDLRALAIFQVLFVHCLYWLSLFQGSRIRSFFLFEMPLFFYVTGAVNRNSKKSYGAFVRTRWSKILGPYYVYAFCCCLLNTVVYLISGAKEGMNLFGMWFSWLVPSYGRSILPQLNSAMWFIPVYMIVIALYPILKKADTKISFPLLFMILVLGKFRFIRNVAFYSFWALAGSRYDGKVYKNYSITALLVLVLIAFYPNADFQNAKIDTNLAFLLFSGAWMSVILPGIKQHPLPHNRITKLLKYNSMNIYFYHSFIFLGLRIMRYFLNSSGVTSYAFQLVLFLSLTICGIFFVPGSQKLLKTSNI